MRASEIQFSLFVFLTFLLVCGAACKSKKVKSDIVDVKFSFTQTSDYCGGAAPPEDLLKQLAEPIPLKPRKVFFARIFDTEEGSRMNIDEYYIDTAHLTLPFNTGKYTVYLNMEKYLSNASQVTSGKLKCYKDWAAQPVGEMTITSNTKKVKMNLHLTCDPCVEPAP